MRTTPVALDCDKEKRQRFLGLAFSGEGPAGTASDWQKGLGAFKKFQPTAGLTLVESKERAGSSRLSRRPP